MTGSNQMARQDEQDASAEISEALIEAGRLIEQAQEHLHHWHPMFHRLPTNYIFDLAGSVPRQVGEALAGQHKRPVEQFVCGMVGKSAEIAVETALHAEVVGLAAAAGSLIPGAGTLGGAAAGVLTSYAMHPRIHEAAHPFGEAATTVCRGIFHQAQFPPVQWESPVDADWIENVHYTLDSHGGFAMALQPPRSLPLQDTHNESVVALPAPTIVSESGRGARSQQAPLPRILELPDESLEISPADSMPGPEISLEMASSLHQLQGLQAALHEHVMMDWENHTPENTASVHTSLQEIGVAVDAFSGMARLCGQADLARQITGIYHNGAQIAESVILLASATLSPVGIIGAIGGIANGAAGITSLFSPEDKTHEQVMQAIAQIAAQVAQLREEMHTRFDHLEYMMNARHLVMLESFAALRHVTGLTLEHLQDLKKEMARGFLQTGALLSQIATQVRSILTFLSDNRLLELTEKLATKVYSCLEDAEQTPDAFRERATWFRDFGTFTIRNASCSEQVMSEDAVLPPAACDAQINLLAKAFYAALPESDHSVCQGGNMVNPGLWTLSAMTTLFLTCTQYRDADCEETTLRVTHMDIERLRKLLASGQEIADFIQQLRANVSYVQTLQTAHHAALFEVQASLHEWLEQQAETMALRQHLEVRTYLQEQYVASDTLELLNTGKALDASGMVHEFAPKIYGNWGQASGQMIEYASNSNAHWGVGVHPFHIEKMNWVKTNYLTAQRAQILKQVETVQAAMRHRTGNQDALPMPAFIYPHQRAFEASPDMPLPALPVTDYLIDYLLNEDRLRPVFEAIRLGAGHLEMQYYIHSLALSDTSRANLSEYAQWAGFPLQQSRTFQVNIYLNKGQASQKRVAAFSIPYPESFYTLGEGLWWWWMGGSYSHSAEGVSTGYTRQCDSNPNQCHCPVSTPTRQAVRPGMQAVLFHPDISRLFQELSGRAPLESESGMIEQQRRYSRVITYAGNLDEIRALNQAALKDRENSLREQLLDCLETQTRNPVSLKIKQYSTTFNQLKLTLAFVCRDAMQDPEHPIHRWFHEQPPSGTTLKKMLETWQPGTESLAKFCREYIENTYSKLQGFYSLQETLLETFESNTGYALLDAVLSALQSSIEYYEPYAVSANRWYQDAEVLQQLSNAKTASLVRLIEDNVRLMIELGIEKSILAQRLNQSLIPLITELRALAPDARHYAYETEVKPVIERLAQNNALPDLRFFASAIRQQMALDAPAEENIPGAGSASTSGVSNRALWK